MQRIPLPGKYRLSVGGTQPDNPRPSTSDAITSTVTIRMI
jgi:hypothetical protein